MSFDLGFDFRNSGVFVSDAAFAVPVIGEAYPHTYTNANGDSINAGFSGATDFGTVNRSNTNDARIAGVNYSGNAAVKTFTVDLSSGSAPGAGTYTVDLAMGDTSGNGDTQKFQLLDNTTVLIDANAGITVAGGHYVDATLADVAATTSWTGATASKTFATTTVKLTAGVSGSGYTRYAHFRLTLQGAPPPPAVKLDLPMVMMPPMGMTGLLAA